MNTPSPQSGEDTGAGGGARKRKVIRPTLVSRRQDKHRNCAKGLGNVSIWLADLDDGRQRDVWKNNRLGFGCQAANKCGIAFGRYGYKANRIACR